jgi:hypothetical protein
LAERPLGLKEAVADACVARKNDVEKRAEPYRSIGSKIKYRQKVEFAELV